MITVNALANTGNKMLTNHHPLPNYIYLDGQNWGEKSGSYFLKGVSHLANKDEIYSLIILYTEPFCSLDPSSGIFFPKMV